MHYRQPVSRFACAGLIAACAVLATAASARALILPDDNELLLSGGFFHAQDSDSGNLNLDASYGRYLADPQWQFGIAQTVNWAIIDDAADPWSATTTPFFNWHFLGPQRNNLVVPFLGAFVGAVWNDDDITGTLGPQAGLKFLVTPHTFIQTKYRYEWFFDELEQADDESDDGNHVVSLGIGYVWGGVGDR